MELMRLDLWGRDASGPLCRTYAVGGFDAFEETEALFDNIMTIRRLFLQVPKAISNYLLTLLQSLESQRSSL
jgi:hypothetical protein